MRRAENRESREPLCFLQTSAERGRVIREGESAFFLFPGRSSPGGGKGDSGAGGEDEWP
ncbi:hypothetical protein GCWU000341_02700 [Oribacterium sp. oral taxon 078 str. F0262]|nr:hypothetical protein GCWU000341_02700 [Oribacterium sp. oral taxon 078 str. F0262]